MFNFISKTKYIDHFFILVLLSLILLIPRLDGLNYFSGKYLWAEDGLVFINEASKLGYLSIINPYAGYLHLYPRIITLVSQAFTLMSQPDVLFFGWVIGYLYSIFIIIEILKKDKVNFLSLTLFILLISLQPNYGENFFTITNTQWMMGATLSIITITCNCNNWPSSPRNIITTIIYGLTGPFCLLLLPICILKFFLDKDFRENRWFYLTLIACMFLQFYFLSNSNRIGDFNNIIEIKKIIKSVLIILLFGAKNLFSILLALLFWAIFFMVKSKKQYTQKFFFTYLTIIIFIFCAEYSHKEDPLAISPIGSGTRYSWIPYSLIFYLFILKTNERKFIQLFGTTLLMIIFLQSLSKVQSRDLGFKSYVNFLKYEEVSIPISPQVEKYPGWSINIEKDLHKKDRVIPQILELDKIKINNGEFINNKELYLTATSEDLSIIFTESINFSNCSDVGVKISLHKNKKGWVQIFWTNSPADFKEEKSQKRWYENGDIEAKFAFNHGVDYQNGFYLRVDPLDRIGEVMLKKVYIYCLP
jgi:hypothetical protein